jgi:nitrate/TMAO reductase-like tetraheme cytochrome c subunit
MPEERDDGGRIRRMWRSIWRPSARWSVAALLVIGGAGGVVAWGGFNTFMEHTNTLEFCIYKTSAHWTNASGVRAICSDCHVPKEWTAKLIRKIQATGELYHHFAGTIDTPEKFAEERLRLAEHVWATMKASDSRECRNCHSFEAMDFHQQTPRAAEKMQEAMKTGQTCIDCHKGIAHKLPPRDD